MQEGACREQSEPTGLRFEDLPFASIPGQSKLFLQYLSDPVSLKRYYPSSVENLSLLTLRTRDVLDNHVVDREAMCEVLMDQNKAFGGGSASAENILKLKENDCVAVLTGQQAGLFTGPLYTIYKALSAIRVAEKLNEQGIKAVPVFWIATEDHDFEEVSNACAIGTDGKLAEARYLVPVSEQGKPVGKIAFDETIRSSISNWLECLPQSPWRSEVERFLYTAYTPAIDFGLAFGRVLAKLFEKYGLVIFDPLDERVMSLSKPLIAKAIEHADEIAAVLQSRNSELEADGFHAQVLVEPNYFPMFWIDDEGKRLSIKNAGSGKLKIAGNRSEISHGELKSAAEAEPIRFSTGVMLRPVVQDFLFPTICYIGGGAEIAYFAQNSEVYRILERPVTPILHRQSLSIVEPKHARTMEKYDLRIEDAFRGFDAVLTEVIERVVDPATPKMFDKAKETISTELDRIDERLSQIDPTLAANLATRRRKIDHHMAALRTKFERVRITKDEIANRRLHGFFTALYPNEGLQERTLNIAHIANLYGVQFIDWVYDAIDADNKDHRVLFLS